MNSNWTFFTNHAHVLFCLAAEPDLRVRELAVRVGITERAAQRIIADLAKEGFLVITRTGRRNHYRVPRALPLRHPVESHRSVGDLLAWLSARSPRRPRARPTNPAGT